MQRAAFRRAFQQRFGRQVEIHYPHALRSIPKFALWLEDEVAKAANSADKPSDEEVEESRLPEKVGTAYRAMYVHGMHFKIRSAEEEKVTCDSGVASAMWRRIQGRAINRAEQFETAEYVGWIEEILELNY
jgi:hypothetical protein